MNIKRALRIAQEQPWFELFKEYVTSFYGDFEKFLNKASKFSYAKNFINGAFAWFTTKEGQKYWSDVCDDFVKKYYDKSVKIFVKEACGKEPVAKLINATIDDEQRFVSALKDTGICYDSVVREGKDLVAYKNSYKIVEEWI